MIALIVIIAILLAFNLLPVGVDGGYAGAPHLALKIGPFRMALFPAPEKTEEQKRLDAEEKKLKAEKKAAKKLEKEARAAEKRAKKGLPEPEKKKPDKDFIFALAGMGFRALGRFRRRLSVDLFRLHFTSGGDPYSAAMNYGYVSAAFGTLLPLLDDVFRIHERDVALAVDFDGGKTRVDFRLILTIQIWEILYIALAFGAEFIIYKIRHRRKRAKPDAKTPAAA